MVSIHELRINRNKGLQPGVTKNRKIRNNERKTVKISKKSRIKENLTHANRIRAGAKEGEYEKIGYALGEFMFYTSK